MIIISMYVRNEVDRHLARALECVSQIDGLLVATDDASTDETPEMLRDVGAELRVLKEPKFWEHEGRARQAHYDWLTHEFASPGDWILSLDGDETISRPSELSQTVALAGTHGVILLPLYEFWTESEYRADGFWFGTLASRLYRYQENGQFRDVEMGCGSEPTYVQGALSYRQDVHHLLHWGYLNPEDRVRKQQLYSERLGGHGHNNTHIDSITTEPVLKPYVEAR